MSEECTYRTIKVYKHLGPVYICIITGKACNEGSCPHKEGKDKK